MPYLVTSDCMVGKTKVRTVNPPADITHISLTTGLCKGDNKNVIMNNRPHG